MSSSRPPATPQITSGTIQDGAHFGDMCYINYIYYTLKFANVNLCCFRCEVNDNFMISPILQKTFNWTFDDSEDKATVTFMFPVTFNINCIECQLIQNNEVISVIMPDAPLLLYGTLYDKAKGLKVDIDESNQKMTCVITKEENKPWPIVVKSVNPETRSIDPKSAFELWSIISRTDATEEVQKHGAELLQNSAQTGFLPALKSLGTILLTIPETRIQGVQLLERASEMYHDADATCQLGNIFCLNPESRELGLNLLKKAADMGSGDAYLAMGQLASPLSETPGEKNGKVALEYLNKCAQLENPHPMVFFELAKLYKFGCDEVEKDEAKGDEYYAKFCKIMADFGEQPLKLEQPKVAHEEEESGYGGLLFGVVLGVTVGAFAYAVYRHVSKRK